MKRNKKKHYDIISVFLILLGLVIVTESFYYFLFFYSLLQTIGAVAMSPFIIFTYLFIALKFITGIMAIIIGRKERKRS